MSTQVKATKVSKKASKEKPEEKHEEKKKLTRYQNQKRQFFQALRNREVLIKPIHTKRIMKDSFKNKDLRVGSKAAQVAAAALEQYLNHLIGIGLDLATNVSKRKTAGIKHMDVIKAFLLTAPTMGLNTTDIAAIYKNFNDRPTIEAQ